MLILHMSCNFCIPLRFVRSLCGSPCFMGRGVTVPVTESLGTDWRLDI